MTIDKVNDLMYYFKKRPEITELDTNQIISVMFCSKPTALKLMNLVVERHPETYKIIEGDYKFPAKLRKISSESIYSEQFRAVERYLEKEGKCGVPHLMKYYATNASKYSIYDTAFTDLIVNPEATGVERKYNHNGELIACDIDYKLYFAEVLRAYASIHSETIVLKVIGNNIVFIYPKDKYEEKENGQPISSFLRNIKDNGISNNRE